jgi:O-antigen/teichoic acid export membrane protein
MLSGDTLDATLVDEPAIRSEPRLTERVARSILWTSLSEWIPRGVMVGSNLYLARILTPAEFGLFALAQATVQFLWSAVDLGSGLYGAREVARTRNRAAALLGSLLTLRLSACVVVLSLYSLGVVLFAEPGSRAVMLAAGLFLATYGSMTDWLLRGLERMDLSALANAMAAIALAAGLVVLVHAPAADVKAVLVWSGSYGIAATLSLVLIKWKMGIGYKPDFSVRAWVHHLRHSMVVWFAGFVAVGTYQVVISLVAIDWSPQEVARLAGPYRLVLAVASASFVIPLAAYPVMAGLSDHNDHSRISGRLLAVMLLFVAPLAILSALNGPLVARVLLGGQYESAAEVLSILSLLLPVQCTVYVMEISLLAFCAERPRAVASVSGFLVTTVAAAVLVPTLGAFGASLALLIGHLALAAFLAYFHHRVIGPIGPIVGAIARLIPASLVLIAILAWISAGEEWMRVAIGVPTFLLAAACSGAVPIRELRALWQRAAPAVRA